MTGSIVKTCLVLILIVLLISGCGDSAGIRRLLGDESGNESQSEEEVKPDPDELWTQFWTEIDRRDYFAAGETLDFIETLPDAQETSLKYARAFLLGRVGLYDNSLELLNQLNPSQFQPSILVLRGVTLASMHRLEESRRDFEMAETSSFNQPSYVLYVLWTLDNIEGDFESASEIEEILRRFYGADNDAARVAFEAALLRRDFTAAEQALDRETLLPPDDALGRSPDPHYWPLILMDRSRLAHSRGDLDRAIDILEGITVEYPNTNSAWPTLAWLGHISGRIDDVKTWAVEGLVRCGAMDILRELNIEIPDQLSEQDASQSVLIYDSSARLLILLGLYYLGKGDVDTALDCADKAIDLCRYEEGAYYLKGRCYEVTGDFQSALDALDKGLTVAPEDHRLALRYITLADRNPWMLTENLPDPVEVRYELLNHLEARHEEYPLDPETAEELAELVLSEDDVRAVELLTLAHESIPTRLDFALDYAAVLAETGEIDRAKEILNDFHLPSDLPWLHNLYVRSAHVGSSDLIELADWTREIMDPHGEFDPLLDPPAEIARETVVTVDETEFPEAE